MDDALRLDAKKFMAGMKRLARRYPEHFGAEVHQRLDLAITRLESEIVPRTPAGVGGAAGLRGSIHGEVKHTATGKKAVVGTPLAHGEVVEFGRRPGKMPPVAPIKLWVERKLGKSGKEAESTAWAVAMKIKLEGTEGAHMFEKGWEAAEPYVMEQIRAIPAGVVERVKREVLA